MTRYFRCNNPGSCGRFRFVTRSERPTVQEIAGFGSEYWTTDALASFTVGDFRMTPAAFSMPVGGSAEIKLEFTPSTPGAVLEHVRIVVDDCTVREMTIEALSEDPQLAFAGNAASALHAASSDTSTLTTRIFKPAQPNNSLVRVTCPATGNVIWAYTLEFDRFADG